MADLQDLLGEDLYNQVQEKLDDDTELIVNDGDYIPRSRLNDKNDKIELLEGQLEDAKGQLDERDSQLEQLKNDTQTSDELKSRIEKLEEQNSQQKEEYETRIQEQEKDYQTKIEQQQFDNSLDLALRDAQAKNPQAVKALLDTEEIKMDGDKLLGLEEQLVKVKESDSYLFGEEKVTGSSPHQGGGTEESQGENADMNSFIRQKAGRI